MRKITKLEQWRRDNGISYEELGHLIGCTRQHAHTICRAGMQASLKVQKILEITGGVVDIKDLHPGTYVDESEDILVDISAELRI